jgi:orotidine-5'-phosphate decarboxylase
MQLYLPADPPTASEAVQLARSLEGVGLGFRVGPRLLARSGVAVVTALRRFGPVLVDARLSGGVSEVEAAARTLASGGASAVTFGPACGLATADAAARAMHPYGVKALAVAVAPELDEGEIDLVTGGLGRGRMVSRIARAVERGADLGLLGIPADLGVVAQVAAGMHVVVAGIGSTAEISDVRDRGATGAVLVPGVVGPDVASAAVLIDAAG